MFKRIKNQSADSWNFEMFQKYFHNSEISTDTNMYHRGNDESLFRSIRVRETKNQSADP